MRDHQGDRNASSRAKNGDYQYHQPSPPFAPTHPSWGVDKQPDIFHGFDYIADSHGAQGDGDDDVGHPQGDREGGEVMVPMRIMLEIWSQE